MKKILKFLLLALFLLLMLSCDDSIEMLEKGESINSYIFPYLEFVKTNGGGYSVYVVNGGRVEKLVIPDEIEIDSIVYKVESFNGFRNSIDSSKLRDLVLSSSSIKIEENAIKNAESLYNISYEKVEENALWGELPKLEKKGKCSIKWVFSDTGEEVLPNTPIVPNKTKIEPIFEEHILVKKDGLAPTCTTIGYKEYYECSTCYKIFSDISAFNELTEKEKIEMLPHSLVCHEAQEPTCIDEGKVEYWKCSVCNNCYKDEECTETINEDEVVIPAKGHSITFIKGKPATINESGIKDHYKCIRCNTLFKDSEGTTVISEEDTVITKIPHNHFLVWKFNDTEHWKACKNEDCTVDSGIDKGKHSFDEGRIDKEPSETEKGEKILTCKTCNYEKTVDIPATGNHDYSVFIKIVSSTCTKGGYTLFKCKYCDLTVNKNETPALGHKKEHFEKKDATCTEYGCKEYWYCDRCHSYFLEEDMVTNVDYDKIIKINKLDHLWGEYIITLNDPNKHYKKCKNCDATTEAKDHIFIEKVSGNYLYSSATCEEAALYYKSCESCGAKSDKTFTNGEPLGHDLEHFTKVEPQCNKEGSIEYWKCKRCKDLFSDKNAITKIEEKDISINRSEHVGYLTKLYKEVDSIGHKEICKWCKLPFGSTFPHVYEEEFKHSDTEHWHKCMDCTSTTIHEEHDFSLNSDGKEECNTCHFVSSVDNVQDGGLSPTFKDEEPSGKIEYSTRDNKVIFTFTDLNKGISDKNLTQGIKWWLDDVKIDEFDNKFEFSFTYEEGKTYSVKCIYYSIKSGSTEPFNKLYKGLSEIVTL